MYVTASPTVLRFLTSSSGMRTPNFSSAATTTSTIDSESTSRSSVKLLSSWTSAAGMPATSFTISARPARISCSDRAMSVAPYGGWREYTGRIAEGTCSRSGNLDDLSSVGEAGAESDKQGGLAADQFAAFAQRRQREWDGRRRRVALRFH